MERLCGGIERAVSMGESGGKESILIEKAGFDV
jgi:hypothetical protein